MTTLVQLKYGYDRSGNRTHRLDEAATAEGEHFDERYGYDGLQRLTAFDRGQLDVNGNNLTNATLGQTWDLDPTGNWDEFRQTVTNPFFTERAHNAVNEITDIDTPTGSPVWASPPAYDANGNMTTLPKPPGDMLPTPGLGNVPCNEGERRVMTYYAECAPNDNPQPPPCDPDEKCEDKSCSHVVLWECKNRGPRSKSNWIVIKSTLTQCN